MLSLLLPVVLLLAFANGANDNFKGVATLYGSGRLSFRQALSWATMTTLAGSATAIWLGSHLVATFSGKGLVPTELVGDPGFVLAVASGAGLTVLLATRLGFPISTTHALIGALLGAGLLHAGNAVNLGRLTNTALLPLCLSPLIATLVTFLIYKLGRRSRRLLGLREESCLCLSRPQAQTNEMFSMSSAPMLVAHQHGCAAGISGRVIGIEAKSMLDAGHILSAGAVGFARGLNDTPKIVALLAVGTALGVEHAVLMVAVAMAIGGLLAARRVATKVSKEITPMNAGQGFSANLVTAALVIGASLLHVPVSTTHVSVGAIFGIGAVTKNGNGPVISGIIASWIITLPVAGILAASTALLLN